MPIAHKATVPQDFLNQMKSNLTKKSDDPESQTVLGTQNQVSSSRFEPKFEQNSSSLQENSSSQLSSLKSSSTEKKSKYADVMNIRLSPGRRDEIKRFCANCGVTITQYIESSFEFLSHEVAAGKIVISKGGITKVE